MNSNFFQFRRKMERENLPELVIKNFEFYYEQLVKGEKGELPEDKIESIENLPEYSNLPDSFSDIGISAKDKSVFIKLNGGLGTSMGLNNAKSLLKIKEELTFLDVIAKQAINSNIELLLMNSYNTQENSLKLLEKYPGLNRKLPLDFLQHKIPKIDCETLLPAEHENDNSVEWCPPGHGEIYIALLISGMLEKLLDQDIEYAFISNSDNLGAVMDYKILGYFAENKYPFLMEVAKRTESDKKGGHLAKLNEGHLVLRESAQCPIENTEDFQNISKHKFFNTNNIWINLNSLKENLSNRDNILGLPMIVNKKTIDPRDSNTSCVYQLETAMGSAISVFENASAIEVPRSRFAPVKTTEDLLAVRSDNYILTDEFRIVVNPKRRLNPLVVQLDKRYYKLIDDLDSRIPHAPSLVDCEKLSITGDYLIGEKVKFEGVINLENKTGKQILID